MTQLLNLFRISPAFQRVFFADICFQLGHNMLVVVLPTLILEVTHDVTLTGLAFTAEIVAYGVVSPFAGWIADRCEQKYLMLIANAGRFALLTSLLLVMRTSHPQASYLLISLALGIAGTLFTPARAAFLRRLLQGEHLLQAVAVEGTVMFLARLVAPALIATVLLLSNVYTALLVNAGFYLLSNFWLCSGAVRGRPRQPLPGQSPWAELSEGWKLLLTQPSLRALLWLDCIVCIVGMASWSMLVAFLETVLRVPAAHNAWLQGAMGLTGALGTTLNARLPARWLQPGPILVGLTLSYFSLTLADSLPTLILAWAVRGLVIGVMVVMISQSLARLVPDQVAGRVSSAWEQICCLCCGVGSAVTPWILHRYGAAHGFVLCAQAMALIALTWCLSWLFGRLKAR